MWPVHWLYRNSRDIVVRRHQCYDKVTSSSDIVPQRIQELLQAYFEIENNVVLNGEQGREPVWYEKLSLGITICHHLASLVKNGDPQDGFYYPTLTLMMDSYSKWICALYGHDLENINMIFTFPPV